MIDFSDLRIFFPALLISILLLICSCKMKKSIFALIVLIIYILILAITAFNGMLFVNRTFHFIVTFAGIIAGIVTYILIDDIEIRRKVVSKVFTHKYDK